ncbi:MAG: hypothetical protein NPIRA05_01270 [Nitrospirales bacterium]|nr:MAG: hypothetical protein NPIRA05_01270 [Nitrospirales bacterium]
MILVDIDVMYSGLVIPSKTGVTYHAQHPENENAVHECEGYYIPTEAWRINWNLELIPAFLYSRDFGRFYEPLSLQAILAINKSFEKSSSSLTRALLVDQEKRGESYLNWIYCKTREVVFLGDIYIEGSVILVTPLLKQDPYSD